MYVYMQKAIEKLSKMNQSQFVVDPCFHVCNVDVAGAVTARVAHLSLHCDDNF